MVEMVGQRIEAYVSHLSARCCGTRASTCCTAQDGIGGNALATLRARGLIDGFVRTVHHLDDFADAQLHALAAALRRRGERRCSASAACGAACWRREHGIEAAQVWQRRRHRSASARAPEAGDAALARRLGIRAERRCCSPSAASRSARTRCACCRPSSGCARARPACAARDRRRRQAAGPRAYARDFAALGARRRAADRPGQPLLITGPLAEADMPGLYRAGRRGGDALAARRLRPGRAGGAGERRAGRRVAHRAVHRVPGRGAMRWADPFDPASIAAAIASALDTASPSASPARPRRLARRFSWADERAAPRRSSTALPSTEAKREPPCPSCTSTSAGPTRARRAATRRRWWCKDYLAPGQRYPLGDFLARTREALAHRVRARARQVRLRLFAGDGPARRDRSHRRALRRPARCAGHRDRLRLTPIHAVTHESTAMSTHHHPLQRRHRRRRPGRPVDEPLPAAARHRPPGDREAQPGPHLAHAALGFVLPGHAQLAVRPARLAVHAAAIRTASWSRTRSTPGWPASSSRCRRPPLEGVTRRRGVARRRGGALRGRDQRGRLHRRPGGGGLRRLPQADRAAHGRAPASVGDAEPLGAVPQPGAAARGRGAGGRLRASRARRSPKTCTSPAARCSWPPAMRRAARASTAARTWSTGWPTWTTTTCRSRSTRCAKACATTPTTT